LRSTCTVLGPVVPTRVAPVAAARSV
jgi:hypothetical protein